MIKKKITRYAVETYAILDGVDSTILKLNPIIDKYGYQFIRLSLEVLEKEFIDLFSLPEKFTRKSIGTFPDGQRISGEFQEMIMNNPRYGWNLVRHGSLIVIKRKSDFIQTIINSTIDHDYGLQIESSMFQFLENLILQLRLFKNGDIFSHSMFQIRKKSRAIFSRYSGRFLAHSGIMFSLTDDDIEKFTEFYSEKFEINDLTKISISTFNLSYELLDFRSRFITLMTCLESLFNHGNDPISHILARHLSIICSKSEIEFAENYKKFKKLYALRSKIIHKGIADKNIFDSTSQLQNYVRDAINYCRKVNLTSNELFQHFNVRGFK